MNLVDHIWLNGNLGKKDICILDCSWHLPGTNRDGKKEFKEKRIPGAIFFDIDYFSDDQSKYPHMLCSKDSFSKKCSEIGIQNNDHIICYDSIGIFSSARVCWMFEQYGHENVSILNGGLKNWILNNHAIETNDPIKKNKSNYISKKEPSDAVTFEQIKDNINLKKFTLVDARPAGRFEGKDPEPRKELKSGNIEGSLNIPFSTIIDEKTGCLKNDEDILKVFKDKNILDNKELVFSCGSGVAATIVGAAYEKISKKKFKVYDGSWTEWATRNKIFS